MSNIYGNLLPTFSTTFALLTTKNVFSRDIPRERGAQEINFYELQSCFGWFSVYLPEQGGGGGATKPVSGARLKAQLGFS